MKRFTLALLAIFLSVGISQAQTLELQTISTGGADLSNSKGEKMNVVIGEMATEKLKSSDFVLTQGFHQTYLITTSISDDRKDITLTLYPNPTAQNITVDGDLNKGDYQISIYDMRGQTIQAQPYDGNKKEIQLNNISDGQYILVITKEGKLIEQLKFQKI